MSHLVQDGLDGLIVATGARVVDHIGINGRQQIAQRRVRADGSQVGIKACGLQSCDLGQRIDVEDADQLLDRGDGAGRPLGQQPAPAGVGGEPRAGRQVPPLRSLTFAPCEHRHSGLQRREFSRGRDSLGAGASVGFARSQRPCQCVRRAQCGKPVRNRLAALPTSLPRHQWRICRGVSGCGGRFATVARCGFAVGVLDQQALVVCQTFAESQRAGFIFHACVWW